jgi:L-serine dehydratase
MAGMDTIRNLFRIGMGPSSSHTLAPKRAAKIYKQRFPKGPYKVILYGSIAATGVGHQTHEAIESELGKVEFDSRPEQVLEYHPNALEFHSLSVGEASKWVVYSTGGGALSTGASDQSKTLYTKSTMNEILTWAVEEGKPLWMLVTEHEDKEIFDFLKEVWVSMKEALKRGLHTEGVLPGGLKLPRKAPNLFAKSKQLSKNHRRTALLSAYALAVSEENAAGGIVVTAPTCGASGVLPGVLYYMDVHQKYSQDKILYALATAGVIGNLIKTNASISGAEVGCQGEVGTACAMAAAACAQLLGGTPPQIEYAAEMGMEHHLGLTCDPVEGLVQIPCIERNAMAAIRALEIAEYAILSDGTHHISFDQVIETMARTGNDIPSLYRETALGGLAQTSRLYKAQEHEQNPYPFI